MIVAGLRYATRDTEETTWRETSFAECRWIRPRRPASASTTGRRTTSAPRVVRRSSRPIQLGTQNRRGNDRCPDRSCSDGASARRRGSVGEPPQEPYQSRNGHHAISSKRHEIKSRRRSRPTLGPHGKPVRSVATDSGAMYAHRSPSSGQEAWKCHVKYTARLLLRPKFSTPSAG